MTLSDIKVVLTGFYRKKNVWRQLHANRSRKPICDVVAYGERSGRSWRGRVQDMDAAVGGLDAEIVTCIALPIKEHRTNAGSPGTEVVHGEGRNEMLERFQEETF